MDNLQNLPSGSIGKCVAANCLAALLGLPLTSQAAIEFEENGIATKITGGVSYGIGMRTDDRDQKLVDKRNAKTIGWNIYNNLGRNSDDSNLNYDKGDVFTNVITGFVNIAITSGEVKGNLRFQAWNDLSLNYHDVPFGNVPNSYQVDNPLKDSGSRRRGKFDNVDLSNAYLSTSLNSVGLSGTISGGYQNIGWRGYSLNGGSLAALDPIDFPARNRPGVFNEETLIPVPSVKLKIDVNKSTAVEAFYQFSFVPNQEAICGSFFSIGDRARDGCNIGFANLPANPSSDGALLAAGEKNNYARATANEPKNNAQFGVLLKSKLDKDAEITASYAKYDSRRAYTSWHRGPKADSLANPSSNPYISMEYPEKIQQVVLGFKQVAVPAFTYYVDYTFKKDQPLGYPVGDMYQTFTTANSTFLRAQANATAKGALFEGWDSYNTSDLYLGAIKAFKNIAGASSVNLRGELLASYVHDLKNSNVLRYGRPDSFGSMPYPSTAACPATVVNPSVTCSLGGYTSSLSTAVAIGLNATYSEVIPGLVIKPLIAYKYDIKGWSYDGLINEGTHQIRFGADVSYGGFDFNLTSVNYWGGKYQVLRDRDYLTLAVQRRF